MVSCTLADGNIVSTDGLFPLDSILAAEWMRQNHPEEYYNDGAKKELIEFKLPLKKIEINGHLLWAASLAQYKKHGEYIQYWHKRLDQYITEKYLDSPRKINTSSAEYKAYRIPVNVMLINRLVWFCVGEPKEIQKLLSGVKALGKKRSQGFGLIKLNKNGDPDWTVEKWADDWSVYGPEGKVMRIIPFNGQLKESGTYRQWGIKPPYWHRDNQVLAEIPKVGDWNR